MSNDTNSEITRLHNLLVDKATSEKKSKLDKAAADFMENTRVNGCVITVPLKAKLYDGAIAEIELPLGQVFKQIIDYYLEKNKTNIERQAVESFLKAHKNFAQQIHHLEERIQAEQGDM